MGIDWLSIVGSRCYLVCLHHILRSIFLAGDCCSRSECVQNGRLSPTNKLIFGAFLLSGIFWSLGYIILGITTIRSGHFAKWAGVLFTVGAVLFGFGMVIPIRTIGVLLFSIGMIRIGNQLWKNKV